MVPRAALAPWRWNHVCISILVDRKDPPIAMLGIRRVCLPKNCQRGAILHNVKCRKRRRVQIRKTNALTRRDSIGLSRQTWSRNLQRARAENAEEREDGMTSAVPQLVDVHSSTIRRTFIPLDPRQLALQYKPYQRGS